MKKQRGVTLSGLLMVSVVVIFVLLLAFKLFKPYSEYFSIVKIFNTLALKPEVKEGTRRDFVAAWASYAQIENISAIGGDEVDIRKEGSRVVLSASYQVKIPLFKNYTLVVDFNPSSTQ